MATNEGAEGDEGRPAGAAREGHAGPAREGQQNPPARGSSDSSDLAEIRAALAKANREAAANRKRVQELEDAGKSELERLTEKASAAEKRAAEAEAKALRLEIATRKGLPEKLAYRLRGETADELEADADELLALVGTTGGREEGERPPAPPRRDPDLGKGNGSVGTGGQGDDHLNDWLRRASGIRAT